LQLNQITKQSVPFLYNAIMQETLAMSNQSLPEMPDVLASGPQKMTPSEAFVETMADMRLIPVVHEQGSGHMADGYARVSGRHGVVIGQNGPGISNCVTAIAAAKKLIRPLREVAERLRSIAPTFLDSLASSMPRQLAVERS
jgi:hypothetical protein